MGKSHERLSGWKKCIKCGRPLKAKFDDNDAHKECYRCHSGAQLRVRDAAFCMDAKTGKMSFYAQIGPKRYLLSFAHAKRITALKPSQLGHVVAVQFEQAIAMMRDGNALEVKDKPVFEVSGFKPAS